MKTPEQLEKDYSFYNFNHITEYKGIERTYYSKLEKLSSLPFSEEIAGKILELNDWFENQVSACNHRFKHSIAELFDLNSLKIKVQIAEVYNEILDETKTVLVVKKGTEEFIGALFTKNVPEEKNVVKSVLEEREFSYNVPTIDIMLGAYEMLKSHNLLAKDDKTLSCMLHWQHVNGFSDKMFIRNYSLKTDTEILQWMKDCMEKIEENGIFIKDIPEDFITNEMYEKAVKNNHGSITFVPEKYRTETLLEMAGCNLSSVGSVQGKGFIPSAENSFWSYDVHNAEEVKSEIDRAITSGTIAGDIIDYLDSLSDMGIINSKEFNDLVDYGKSQIDVFCESRNNMQVVAKKNKSR